MKTLLILLGVGLLSAQSGLLRVQRRAAAVSVTSLGVHSQTDNNTTSATTVVVSLGTPTAGSTIVCSIKYSTSSTFTSVTDNVNSGRYQPAAGFMREANHNYIGGIVYHENVAASSTTVTLTYVTAGTHSQMACAEIKGTPASYAFDSAFVASQALTAASPTSGTSITPSGDGRFLYAALLDDAGTTTAGTNYTLLDQAGAVGNSQLSPEYWIQTTATASNAPYGNSSGGDYGEWMTAWVPNSGGFCDATMILDWSGGTNGATPTPTTLQSSTRGGAAQSNADRARGSDHPGWSTTNLSPGNTFSTAAYAPLATTRNCPFYSGSATGSLGLSQDTSVATTGGGPSYFFYTTQDRVTAWLCLATDTPVAHAGTIDVFNIGVNDNSDYMLLQVNSNGSSGTFFLEAPGGNISTPTVNWTQNTWYGVRATYNAGGTHKIEYYSFSGSQCTGTPTLMGTHTAASTGSFIAEHLGLVGANANTYTSGSHFYIGAVALDILHGAAIAP